MGKKIGGYLCMLLVFAGLLGLFSMDRIGVDEVLGEPFKTVVSPSGVSSASQSEEQPATYAPNLVVFKRKNNEDRNDSMPTLLPVPAPESLLNLGVETVSPVFKHSLGNSLNRSGISALRATRLQKLKKSLQFVYSAELPKGVSVDAAVKVLASDPDIEWAEPCYNRTIEQVPDDPTYSFQPYLPFIEADSAWDMTAGSPDVVIAVIDTGVDYTHIDLSSNIWINAGEIEGDGVDNDGNGYVDDTRGWDFIDVDAASVYEGEDPGPADNDPMDGHGHGTHVSGIAGAVGNNGAGVTGVCWDVSIMPLRAGYKTIYGTGTLPLTAVADALTYAADNGADIVNMSFGGYANSQLEKAAIAYCAEAGVLLVAGAGNNSTDRPFYPACYENVLSVAASNQTSAFKADYSNFGLNIDVVAPGSNIYNTLLGGGYGYKSGTSMASPVVAGVAALVKAAHPNRDLESVSLFMMTTATTVNDIMPLYAGTLGAGLVDAAAAVQADAPQPHAGLAGLFQLQTPKAGETLRLIPSVRNFSLAEEGASVSLSSTDPHVTVTDGDSVIGDIPGGTVVSGLDDDLSVVVSQGTPVNHMADVQLDISSALSGMIASELVRMNLNPLMSPEMMLTVKPEYTLDYIYSQVLALPGGGCVVLFRSQSFDVADIHVFASVSDSAGVVSLPVKISDEQTRYASEQWGAVSADGRIHVIYHGSVGNWDNEFFYTVRDPADKIWTTPVQITQDAEINSQEYGTSQTAFCLDPSGNPQLVFEDHRNGGAELYYVSCAGTLWSLGTLIHQLDPEKRLSHLNMLKDSTGTGYVFWVQFIDFNNYEIMMIRQSQGTWGEPERVAACQYNVLDVMVDAMDRVHLRYKDYDAGRKVCRTMYDGGTWSPVTMIPDPFYVQDNCMGFVQSPDGLPVMAVWAHGASTIDVYETVFDGSTWHDPVLISTARDIGQLYDGYARDDQDHRFFSGRLYDSINSRGDIFIQTSLAGEASVPERPVISQSVISTEQDKDMVSAAWSSSGPTPVDSYEYAMGKIPGGSDLKYWTYAGALTSVTLDLSGEPMHSNQAYYFNVRARNGICLSPVAYSKMTKEEDLCPDDPNKTSPGVCGCGVADADSDDDGIMDCVDNCPATPAGEDVDSNGCDVSPPQPDPMVFSSLPSADGTSSISMSAAEASDGNNVEYYFEETTGNSGGSDSGWQDSPDYSDTGLTAGTSYIYRVKARDKSVRQNETTASAESTATTDNKIKIGCGAAPMGSDGTLYPARTSAAKALLPLIPSVWAIGAWALMGWWRRRGHGDGMSAVSVRER